MELKYPKIELDGELVSRSRYFQLMADKLSVSITYIMKVYGRVDLEKLHAVLIGDLTRKQKKRWLYDTPMEITEDEKDVFWIKYNE